MLYVDPKHTSQTCPECHHVSKDNRKTQAAFECVECHHQEHADVVAARNIVEWGHRLLACEAGTGKLSDELKLAVI